MEFRQSGTGASRFRIDAVTLSELDVPAWPAESVVTAYGRRIGLRAQHPDALRMLRERLPRVCRDSPPGAVERLYSLLLAGDLEPGRPPENRVYADRKRVARSPDLESVLLYFSYDAGLWIAEHARNRVFVHAAAVGWRGGAVVVPGKSQWGKSTLAAALLRRGAGYLSDDFAVFDPRGRVHPYPRPLSIRKPGSLDATHHEPEAFGGRQVRGPLPVSLIVISPYDGRTEWRPRGISQGRAVLELLRHAIPARSDPARTVETLQTVVAGARVLKGARGEADAAADAILELLETAQSSAR